MTPWVLGTRNAGKLRELTPWFAAHGIAVIDLEAAGLPPQVEEEAVEQGATFVENAVAKARYYHQRLQRPVIADDSGLVLDALGGRPGVRSRRVAADHGVTDATEDLANARAVRALLEASGVPQPWHGGYRCAMAFVDGTHEVAVEGETRGTFLASPRGQGGFGYDPHVWSDELGMTFAEASVALKNAISHRGRACTALLAVLRAGGVLPVKAG